MKLATWNVNSLRVRLDHVLKWMQSSDIDILCLQEIKLKNEDFPHKDFESRGYHCYVNGQKTYNGVAIISRTPLTEVVDRLPGFDDEQARYIAANYSTKKGAVVRFVNVYVPNGQALDSEKFLYKKIWFQHLIQSLQQDLATYPELSIVGDFNIAPTSLDVHDPDKWEGKIHCSADERLMLHRLMSLGLYDSFRHYCDKADRFSWWDYRENAYARNLGLRIDLILSSADLLKKSIHCDIDETPREWQRPSDHTPVVVEFDFEEASD